MSNYQNFSNVGVTNGNPYTYWNGNQPVRMNGGYDYPYPPGDPIYTRTQLQQNPYMQMSNQQPAHPQPRELFCRLVQNEQEIRPNEVQMDGKPSIFVNDRLNEIYLKQWNATGTISTYRYALVTNDQNATGTPDPFELIMQRLDRIESSLSNGKQQTQFQQGKKVGGKQHGQQPNRTIREESNVEES